MTGKERVLRRIAGQPVDRVPNLNIMMQFAAKEIGVTYRDYCTDYKKLAQGNLTCAHKYGFDVVTTMSDPMREAHDLGTQVVFPENDVPYPKVQLLAEKSAIRQLKPVKPEDGKRMSETLRAIEYYKREAGDEFAVIGWVEGMFAEAADLRGVTEFLMDTFDEEAWMRELLEILLEQATMYARAQIAAGADIIGVGDAISSVAGPAAYKQWAGEFQRRILQEIRNAGAKTKLHICGNTTPFLEDMPWDVIDILDVDWMVPLERATQLSKGTCLSGNFDPVAVLLQGDEARVRESVIACANIAGDKFICAAGCEVPKDTPQENLLCVARTLQEMELR